MLRPLKHLACTLLALALLVAPDPAAAQPAASTLDRIRANGVVNIAYRSDATPFSFLDADKRPIGYAIDICNDIVAGLRRDLKLPALRVEYVPVTAASRFEVINSGKADMECGLTVNNPDRRKQSGFAMPYFFAGPRILTRVDSGITDYHHLSDKRVVSAKGANAVPILQSRIERGLMQRTQLLLVDNNQQAMAELEAGRADAFITTDNLLFAFRALSKEPQRYHVVGPYLVVEAVAVMLRKDDRAFKIAIDRVLAGIMLDGAVRRYYSRWFLSPIPPDQRVIGLPMSNLLRDQLRFPVDRTGDEGSAQ